MSSIGIIGFGRFGGLTARYLARDFSVVVSTRSDQRAAIEACGARAVSFETACAQKIVILCMPISAMRETLRRVAPLLSPDALVVDVCSVKVYPVQWMRELLPENVSILPTHPMFGPDSAADALVGRKIVLCPERIDEDQYDRIRRWLESKGLVVIRTTAREHDEKIAVSLSLTHFIGRSLSAFGARDLDIDTEGYKRLMHILGVVSHDTWQLFEDMHAYNPYAKSTRQAFIDAMIGIHERLDG
ncbi:Prephenate dehydrogenase [Desulfosarcina cetonica]|uniref:prephenate dehydrogenase/arogenate dehydrogenase family protein n=1 Tax=Desulfosarcina cetonica TaxID=90730 RepID=UPI0006CF28F7|nr:prephenate dehydrogenase/arogenate dehydrogenase family protein [Desulfosarcina cetonica]VTR69435.1 Prephenate dehydrogenase [Desulfosarcina cetonica]